LSIAGEAHALDKLAKKMKKGRSGALWKPYGIWLQWVSMALITKVLWEMEKHSPELQTVARGRDLGENDGILR
jgi:hypothetical protein